nr:hypothetical protein [Tanacetum cinerariifolium]
MREDSGTQMRTDGCKFGQRDSNRDRRRAHSCRQMQIRTDRSEQRQVKLPMRFNDHVMANLSQRDVLNRSNELNLNEDSYEEIRSKELGKNKEQNEEMSGMDGRGVDVCNKNNGTRNELSMEEHDKMSSSQKTPIQTTANEDVKKSSRVFG